MRAEATYDGEGFIDVVLFDAAGEEDTLIFEERPFDGSQAIPIEEAGKYVLNVEAEGPWTVRLQQ